MQQQCDVPAHGQLLQQQQQLTALCDANLQAVPHSHFTQAQLATGKPASAASGIIVHTILAENARRTNRVVDLSNMPRHQEGLTRPDWPLYAFYGAWKRPFLGVPLTIFGSNSTISPVESARMKSRKAPPT